MLFNLRSFIWTKIIRSFTFFQNRHRKQIIFCDSCSLFHFCHFQNVMTSETEPISKEHSESWFCCLNTACHNCKTQYRVIAILDKVSIRYYICVSSLPLLKVVFFSFQRTGTANSKQVNPTNVHRKKLTTWLRPFHLLDSTSKFSTKQAQVSYDYACAVCPHVYKTKYNKSKCAIHHL